MHRLNRFLYCSVSTVGLTRWCSGQHGHSAGFEGSAVSGGSSMSCRRSQRRGLKQRDSICLSTALS